MTKVTVLGIDASLTATGLCLVTSTDEVRPFLVRPPGPKVACQEERVDIIIRAITREAPNADLLALEGASYGSHTMAYTLGQVSGAIRWALWREDLAFVLVPPATVKKYATGKGNATKDDMVKASWRWIPGNKSNDLADALFLAKYVQENYDTLVEGD